MQRYREQLQPLVPFIFGVGLLLLAGLAVILFLISEGDPVETVIPDTDAGLGTVPDAVMVALTELEARTGNAITLNDLDSFDWQTQRFSDTSLGCPVQGQTYTQVATDGYIMVLVYENQIHEYRSGIDGTPLVYCEQIVPVVPTTAPNTIVVTATVVANELLATPIVPPTP
jgi:hypothetical protein